MRISDWSSDVCSSDLREQSLPQVGPSLLVGADPHPGGGVVGDGDLRGSVVDDLPQLGADQPEVVALQQAGGVGLVDEVFPDQPAADAERAQYVVQGQALLRAPGPGRSEEHTSELQSLMRISYAVFCLKKKKY